MKAILGAVLSVLFLAACSKKNEPAAPGSTTVPPTASSVPVPAAGGNVVVKEAAPMPESPEEPRLSLSANGSSRPLVYQGVPLLITSWAKTAGPAPALELRDSSGAAGPIPAASPDAPGREHRWTRSSEETARMAPGVWRIRAESVEIELTVEAMPAAPTGAQRRSIFLARAGALLRSGKAEDAAALAREEQARVPGDPNPWVLEGDALRDAGRPADAAARYREALRLHRAANPKLSEAPVEILRRLTAVQGPP